VPGSAPIECETGPQSFLGLSTGGHRLQGDSLDTAGRERTASYVRWIWSVCLRPDDTDELGNDQLEILLWNSIISPLTVEISEMTRFDQPVTLLLTATVAPSVGVKNVISDAEQRRSEYQAALLFYRTMIGRVIDRIVFVDNSNSDLSDLREYARGYPIDLISYQGLSYPSAYGYGYGEFSLIQYAMDHIPSIQGLIVKVSGRYIVTNLGSVIKSAKGVHFAGDIWNFRRPWLDLRVLMWTRTGYEALLRDVYLLLRDDVNKIPPEMVLSTHVLRSDGIAVRTYLAADPMVFGRRGFDGRNWGRGRLAMKRRVRAMFRPLMLALGAYPGAARDNAVPPFRN
jgi:hypothetical protein